MAPPVPIFSPVEPTEPLGDVESPGVGRIRRLNRRRIAEASLALLEEGVGVPTAAQVAAKAGLGRRTLFRHYPDLGELFLEVVRLNVVRHQELWGPIPAEGSREARLRALARQRRQLFESVRPVRRAAVALEARFPAATRLLQTGNRVHREQLETLLAPDLEGAPRELVDVLDAVASYDFWERLCARQGLRPPEAEAVLERMLRTLLAGWEHEPRRAPLRPSG